MAEEIESEETRAAAVPLFVVDLGVNGGVLAPTTPEELETWIRTEVHTWTWIQQVNAGSHRGALDAAFQSVISSLNTMSDILNYWRQGNQTAVQERLSGVQENLKGAFVARKFPHSTSPLGRRVLAMKEEDPLAAIAYLFACLPSTAGSSYRFEGGETGSWVGFLRGMIDRFGLHESAADVRARQEALDMLHGRTESEFTHKKLALDELHRGFDETTQKINEAQADQGEKFSTFLSNSEAEHHAAQTDYADGMNALRTAFREEMALRAPVEYWETKAKAHAEKSAFYMRWMFGAMAVLASFLVIGAILLLRDGKPDIWRVSVLVIIGTIGVWAVRLIVRMFLSNSHLATDAEERVTMVKTYLSLLEAQKMPSDEDRKLVLAPLFRPASDGLVKDEGLPHPILELLTRTAK